MEYYIIHLPLEIPRELVYCSPVEIREGARVIVNLSSRLWTGICGKKTLPEEGKDISYKAVIEVLDTCPVLSQELMQLGYWMASYYHCSIGRALFAMLPSRLQPELEANVIWLAEEVPEQFLPLKKAIAASDNSNLKALRKELSSYPLYKRIEEAEELGLIKLKRKLNHKDKPRTVNYIIRLQPPVAEDSLPLKQREAWERIKEEESSFPMSNISSTISYSAVKALVKKGFIKIEPRRFEPESPSFEGFSLLKQIELNNAQLQAIEDINKGFGTFNVNLLYGITGSGKTEVYMELIRRYLAADKTIIFLIPEIALTPQMVDRFQSNFGQILAIQHSQLTEKERLIQWQKIKSGDKRIVIGARSAVFAPLPNLGLIIVDEEHEGTYKQESAPRYQGRDLAIKRAQLQNAQVILGSATPALESWHNALTGKYQLQKIENRPLDYCLPNVQVIDLRDEY
ncbi:MAG TPA: primosomal protein N', partial [Candidatus Cloacimonas sp.]|nr:primosomal protein N' [Candidatus Cloacimonas sp.]